MTCLTASELHDNATDTLSRVAHDGERFILCRNNEEVAALVSLEDLALLDEIEERLDIEAYDRAKKEFEESGRQSVPFEDVCREMGL